MPYGIPPGVREGFFPISTDISRLWREERAPKRTINLYLQGLEKGMLKIGFFAPAEQYVYRICIDNPLHSSGVLCVRHV